MKLPDIKGQTGIVPQKFARYEPDASDFYKAKGLAKLAGDILDPIGSAIRVYTERENKLQTDTFKQNITKAENTWLRANSERDEYKYSELPADLQSTMDPKNYPNGVVPAHEVHAQMYKDFMSEALSNSISGIQDESIRSQYLREYETLIDGGYTKQMIEAQGKQEKYMVDKDLESIAQANARADYGEVIRIAKNSIMPPQAAAKIIVAAEQDMELKPYYQTLKRTGPGARTELTTLRTKMSIPDEQYYADGGKLIPAQRKQIFEAADLEIKRLDTARQAVFNAERQRWDKMGTEMIKMAGMPNSHLMDMRLVQKALPEMRKYSPQMADAVEYAFENASRDRQFDARPPEWRQMDLEKRATEPMSPEALKRYNRDYSQLQQDIEVIKIQDDLTQHAADKQQVIDPQTGDYVQLNSIQWGSETMEIDLTKRVGQVAAINGFYQGTTVARLLTNREADGFVRYLNGRSDKERKNILGRIHKILGNQAYEVFGKMASSNGGGVAAIEGARIADGRPDVADAMAEGRKNMELDIYTAKEKDIRAFVAAHLADNVGSVYGADPVIDNAILEATIQYYMGAFNGDTSLDPDKVDIAAAAVFPIVEFQGTKLALPNGMTAQDFTSKIQRMTVDSIPDIDGYTKDQVLNDIQTGRAKLYNFSATEVFVRGADGFALKIAGPRGQTQGIFKIEISDLGNLMTLEDYERIQAINPREQRTNDMREADRRRFQKNFEGQPTKSPAKKKTWRERAMNQPAGTELMGAKAKEDADVFVNRVRERYNETAPAQF